MRRIIQLASGRRSDLGLSDLGRSRRGRGRGLPPGPSFGGGADHVVFVQTDNTAGNQVVAYDRADNGSLTSLTPTTPAAWVGS